jgi:hypothetical protein
MHYALFLAKEGASLVTLGGCMHIHALLLAKEGATLFVFCYLGRVHQVLHLHALLLV